MKIKHNEICIISEAEDVLITVMSGFIFFLFLIQWRVTLTSINHWKELPNEFVHSEFRKSLNPDWTDF